MANRLIMAKDKRRCHSPNVALYARTGLTQNSPPINWWGHKNEVAVGPHAAPFECSGQKTLTEIPDMEKLTPE